MLNNSDRNYPQDLQARQLQDTGTIDLLAVLTLIVKHWYVFIICLSGALFFARFYIRHTLPMYRTSSIIVINERDDRSMIDNFQVFQGLGMPGGLSNIENQMTMLRSRALIEKTLNHLPFEIEYYYRTLRNKMILYPDPPLSVVSDTEIPIPKDTEISITYLGNNMYNIESTSDILPLNKTGVFGENIEISQGSFRVECRNEQWFAINSDQKLYFIINSRTRLINSYAGRIRVEQMSRGGSILNISLIGTNRTKDVDFINNHLEGFLAISLDRKNSEAQRRIQFIDDQLVGITDSLNLTENRLQQFRSSHRVMNLSAQGQAIISQVSRLDDERVRLNLEAGYYDYLAEYLDKDVTGEIPIVPITMGITDQGLTRLVEELAALQGQLSSRGAGVLNPLQKNLEQRVIVTKNALRETLNGLRRANGMARLENQEQINRANTQAATLPVTERQLLGIERKFQLNNELYTFLLEAKATQEMQKASNRADSEVFDRADARFSAMVSPNKKLINLASLFAGFFVPFIILYLNSIFSQKLKQEDIKKITNLPVVGNIPRNTENTNNVVFDYPNSSTAESFRILRSRMQFFIKDSKSPVILITSAMPGDGKTFLAINLASSYSVLGKKTILVGFDLRKPKIFMDFNLSNEKGLSSWLIGAEHLNDIIQETQFENLYIIPSGPIPPNPSELTLLPKTEELFKLLKERFEYIIIDSSPIGIVSDSFHLASLADVCLIVVRPLKTFRDILESTLNQIITSRIKDVSLVINDIRSNSRLYGYGEKYGYTNNKKRKRKVLFKTSH